LNPQKNAILTIDENNVKILLKAVSLMDCKNGGICRAKTRRVIVTNLAGI
jgi:hypothetical protein